VGLLQLLHAGLHEAAEPPPALHWLRDAALALGPAVLSVWVASLPAARRLAARFLPARSTRGPTAGVLWALMAATAFALSSVPGNEIHGRLFGAVHAEGSGFSLEHVSRDGSVALLAAFLFLLGVALWRGTPWEPRRRQPRGPGLRPGVAVRRAVVAVSGAVLALSASVTGFGHSPAVTDALAATPFQCGSIPGTRTLSADVVALDQPFFYNRLGADNPGGMMYALRGDVVVKSGPQAGTSLALLTSQQAAAQAGNVILRPEKRPRPLTLRMNVGDCLLVNFQNLLAPNKVFDDQLADRNVGMHVKGVTMVDPDGAGPLTGIDSDGTFVGNNQSSLAAPGEARPYEFFAEHENTYLIDNPGSSVAEEGAGGTAAFGLFGALNVEPFGTDWYRSQVTRVDMDMAAAAWTFDPVSGWTPAPTPQLDAAGNLAVRLTDAGQPVVNYDARYPAGTPLAGLPILRILDPSTNQIVHPDLNAVMAGPAGAGFKIPLQDYPLSYWNNQVYNMGADRGQEPFREFTVVFHDEIFARQAFPQFNDPTFEKVLAGVKDGFAINYGTGGIGAEILANRLGVGPEANCTECKYEEFFLASWAVGDPAMVVDVPANTTDAAGNLITGAKATMALYPDDPSNVHHSYINDRVKFRNLHAGPKEHHIFHLHAHQWTFTPNTEKSSYLDSQLIGPGQGYTYEIANGGSGNRNKVVGDSIFHCHFYPHFAQGMWELWRSHDVFERGTVLDAAGRPVAGARALPDGEITAGTPIPALVPMPSRPMAPVPNAATQVVPYDLNGDGRADSSQIDNDGNGVADVAEAFAAKPAVNPGFPFFIPGVGGHRAPTPVLDIVDANGDGQVEDGGLNRHVVLTGQTAQFATPLDFNKTLEKITVAYLPEGGTPAELTAMDFHSQLWHPTFLPDGTPIDSANPQIASNGRPLQGFETNGLPAVQGAPYAEPCRADPTAANNWAITQTGSPRLYKAAVIQLDATINKVGWHFPQERIETLQDDAGATLTGARAPEPMVIRLDVNDCAQFWHTNLMPNVYQLDDYELRTPTDVVGQHIHLVKFDVTSADGSSNGFNYEDGTFSPQEVVERIDAVRAQTGTCTGNDRIDLPGETSTQTCPLARAHPFFKNVAGVGDAAWGARTTMQRWYADPLMNNAWDRGLGTVFTHDHFGPSTHQQVGLYSTVLVEPEASKWRDPETGTIMGSREDGGPTSWKADILWQPNSDTRNANAHREFFLEYADFQHAYQKGGGALHTQDNGAGVQIPSYADFVNAINPSNRQEPPAGNEKDLYFHPNVCQNGLPRPCAEAISADDVGTFVVNYRNEPVAERVFNPATGGQTAGPAGDLADAFQSRTDRAVAALNTQPKTYPALTADVQPGDPWTPLLRVYGGDKVRVRGQVGATEEEHTITIHGVKWLQEGMYPNSGFRDSQSMGISEYFNLNMPVLPDLGPGTPTKVDYLYTMGAATDDLWNGIWGLMRSYQKAQANLLKLPNNPIPSGGWTVSNKSSFNSTCPTTAPARSYVVHAVRAADVLGPNGLVYNSRTTAVTTAAGVQQGAGPLVDPNAMLYVQEKDLVLDGTGKPIGLKPGTPVEPLVLRANSGDCVGVRLVNNLPSPVPYQAGFNSLPAIVHKNENVNGTGGIVTFNANDITPSSLVGLHPQLLQYDVRTDDGLDVGGNSPKLIPPGAQKSYQWYAGDVQSVPDGSGGIKLVANPVELGAGNLMPADRIKGFETGLVAAMVVEPPGASWSIDPGRNTSATVSFPDGTSTLKFREFVPILQDDVNLHYAGGCTPTAANLNCAVPAITSEGVGAAEDAEDGGQKAISYGADPLWFRLGISPETGFSDPVLRDNPNIHKLFSNSLVGGDPKTPVFVASLATASTARIRLLEPGGHARGHVFVVNGHVWQREPYVGGTDQLGSPRISWNFHDDPTVLNVGAADGTMPGHNMVSQWVSAQEGVSPSEHFDLVLQLGGKFQTRGDYLFRDNASFGNYQGLWGILRVTA